MRPTEIEKEFEEAIARYGAIITKICYCYSRNSDEFNDLRQEAFYNIWKGWGNFRNDSKLSTWIYKICLNTCISFQRKESKSNKTISISEIINLPADEDSSRLQKYNTMHALIRKLNFQERAIILMWLDEKSYEEIAELMGSNRNTIAVKIKRIKDKLIRMSHNIE